MLRTAFGQTAGLALGLGMGAVLFIGGFLVALTAMDAGASHDGDNTVHVCVSPFTRQARFVPAGQAPNCANGEQVVDLAAGGVVGDIGDLGGQIEDLEEQLGDLEAENEGLRDDLGDLTAQVPACLSEEDDGAALFDGCDVQIVNGLDETETSNGTGNLIVGYNENDLEFDRGGSHYLVVGRNNGYSNFGGIVAGRSNQSLGDFANVTGGTDNTASDFAAHVSGGQFNDATGPTSSVTGGALNTASGFAATVGGGEDLEADDSFEFLP